MIMRIPDLLPCPFCARQLDQDTDGDEIWWCHPFSGDRCVLEGGFRVDLGDVAKWNARAEVAADANRRATADHLVALLVAALELVLVAPTSPEVAAQARAAIDAVQREMAS